MSTKSKKNCQMCDSNLRSQLLHVLPSHLLYTFNLYRYSFLLLTMKASLVPISNINWLMLPTGTENEQLRSLLVNGSSMY